MKGAIAFLVLSVTVLFLILLFALKPWGSTTTTRAPSPPETMVLPMPIPNLIPEIPQIPPADTTLAKPPSAAMQMQFTAIINWWDKDDPDTPSKVAQRLGFAPNIGTFYDLTKEWPRDRFANEINQIVEMRSKFKNLWSPIVIDVAILPRGGFPAFEALFDQIGNSFKEAEAKGIRVRTRALTEVGY